MKSVDTDKIFNPPEEPPVKRRLRDKSVDVDKIFKPPEEPPVKRRIRAKSVDVEKLYKPPEEEPPLKKRDASTKPTIKVVPVKTPTEHFYIADDFDPKTITKKELLKYTSKKLNDLLEKLGVAKEVPVTIRGKLVKKHTDKINKVEKIKLIHAQLPNMI